VLRVCGDITSLISTHSFQLINLIFGETERVETRDAEPESEDD